jgi:hypothetical protein
VEVSSVSTSVIRSLLAHQVVGPHGEASSPRIKKEPVPEWLKNVSSKKEAVSAFRAQMRKHHPDMGGDEEMAKKLNVAWESFQKHHFDKLSFVLPSFLDELSGISNG